MLVNSFYMNVIILSYSDELVDIVLVYSKFAFWAARDHVIWCACSELGVYANIDVLTFQPLFVGLKSLKGSNIKSDTCIEGVVQLFSRDEILSVHDLVRFITALESLVDLSRRDHIYSFDA